MSLSQPLPERLRPSELALFVGQSHLAERLTTLLEGPRLPSLLLFGPPGCGKSTLALLLARARGGNVLRLSAPEAGLQQLRRQLTGVDILVLDELHRFSKAQQDFFLPLLESGDLTMIATTTENPSFSVTRQLLSRLHVLRLRQLGRPELLELGKRGAAALSVTLNDEILDFLSTAAHGDARTMLNLVEYASSLPEEKRKPSDYALTTIMEKYGFQPEELLVVDDMKLAYTMAKKRNVPIAFAAWGRQSCPEICREMRTLCDYSFDRPEQLEEFQFGRK